MGENGLSVSDALALKNSGNCGQNDMFGGNNMWWIIILILFFGMGRGFGYGGYGNGMGEGSNTNGALTRGDLCMDMNFNDLQNAIRSNAAENNSNFRGVDNAICQIGYQNTQLVNGVERSVDNGFARLDTSLCQLGNNLTQTMTTNAVAAMQSANAIQGQLSNCCCDIREAISGVNYNNAMANNALQSTLSNMNYNAAMNTNSIQKTLSDGFCQTNFNAQSNTRDIIEAQNANTRAILDKLTAQEIAAKDAQIAAQTQQIFGLQLKASQEAQNAYLINQLGQKCPIPAYLACPPNAPYNYSVNLGNNNCGCC